MRSIVAAVLLLLAGSAFADGWEYKVLHLPPTFEMKGMTPQPRAGVVVEQADGSGLNVEITEILNRLAAEGWELIGITGSSGGSHAAYLRRPRTP